MDCGCTGRRSFLADTGMGFTGLVLGALFHRDALARQDKSWAPPDGKPHAAPRAKSVIWLFMKGGASHMETFDPKPELNRFGGKKIGDTPYKDTYAKGSLRELTKGTLDANTGAVLLPTQVGFRKYGESGIEVSDWWPHVGGCVDDLAVVRSFWTTDIGHTAQLQFHTGRHFLDGVFPTIGSWVHYGLGTLNENLPQFVVLGDPVIDAFTRSTRPAFNAKDAITSSAKLPSVEVSSAPTVGPVWPASSSVAEPRTPARGTIASALRMKMTIGEACITLAPMAIGTKMRTA